MAKRKFQVNAEQIIDKDDETKDETAKQPNEITKTTDHDIKVGRPKGVPTTKISLNVPDEYLELVNIAAGLNYKGNTSSYINTLIKEDINKNKALYEQIKALKKA